MSACECLQGFVPKSIKSTILKIVHRMRIDYGNRTTILVCLLFSAVIVSYIGYILIRGPSTIDEGRALEIAERHVKPPADAICQGVRLLNISEEEFYVVSWKSNSSLIEVQMNNKGRVVDKIDYHFSPEESNSSISKMLARKIAEGLLICETNYSPANQELKEPEVFYVRGVGGGAGYWKFYWQRQVGNFTIFGAEFLAKVDADTGKAKVWVNTLDEVPRLEPPERIEISRERAMDIAWNHFAEHLENASLRRFTRVILGIMEHPEGSSNYSAVWRVDVEGTGIEDGQLVWEGTAFLIDALSGDVIDAVTVGVPIVPLIQPYEYYDNDYPIIKGNIDAERALSFAFECAEKWAVATETPSESVLEMILETVQRGKPVWAVYWVRTFNCYKTGTIFNPRTYDPVSRYSPTTDSLLVVLDPEDGSLISHRRIWNMTPPGDLYLHVSKDQALQIIESSEKVDPRNEIVKDKALVYAEPRVMLIDWIQQLRYVGDYERIYISPIPTNESRLYWMVEYSSGCGMHGCYHGRYVVDAATGELMLAIEDRPMVGPLPFNFSIEPSELVLRRGESSEVVVKVNGRPNYDVPFTVSLEIEQVPTGISVSVKGDFESWKTDREATFTLTISADPDAPNGITHVSVDIGGIGFSTGCFIDIEIV